MQTYRSDLISGRYVKQPCAKQALPSLSTAWAKDTPSPAPAAPWGAPCAAPHSFGSWMARTW